MNKRDCHDCEMKDGLLCHKSTKNRAEVTQVVIPKQLQPEIIRLVHDSIIGYHMGVSRTIDKVSNNFWWRGLKESVRAYVKSCPVCNERKGDRRKAPLAPEPRISRPFQTIGIDFMELSPSKKGNRYVFVVINHATKWVEALACNNEGGRNGS